MIQFHLIDGLKGLPKVFIPTLIQYIAWQKNPWAIASRQANSVL